MRSRFNLRTTFLLRLHATGCKQESRRAGKQASKQADKQDSKRAGMHANKPTRQPARQQASKQASKHKSKPCKPASKEHPGSKSRTQMDRCRTPDADIVVANAAATRRPKPPLSVSHAAGWAAGPGPVESWGRVYQNVQNRNHLTGGGGGDR